jgi:hypothetical protein
VYLTQAYARTTDQQLGAAPSRILNIPSVFKIDFRFLANGGSLNL